MDSLNPKWTTTMVDGYIPLGVDSKWVSIPCTNTLASEHIPMQPVYDDVDDLPDGLWEAVCYEFGLDDSFVYGNEDIMYYVYRFLEG
jgi:hypothetical protein